MTGENAIERFRLFVAITVPDRVRNEMIGVQSELRSLAPPDVVRWARPEQFHLTLRFLGDVSSDRAAALREAVRAVCSGAPRLSARARGIGLFPNAHSPRVVWVGIDDNVRLTGLQSQIERAVRPFSTGPGGEHFAGHVTLGRFKPFKGPGIVELAARVAAMNDRILGEWTAQKVEIIRSELSSSGARHTTLAAFSLGAEIELF
jgi:2'-5' RNA ligase